MKKMYWMLVAAAVVPLVACSSDDDGSGSGGDSGSGGRIIGGSDSGTGGSVVGGSGGGTAGGDTGGTGGTATGGTGGTASSSCPTGMTEVDNGGQCMCALPCTAGDDSACAQAMAGAHCCDFSSAGFGFLCGADQQATCDSLIGTQCGSGGGGTGGLACDALTQGQVPECDTCAASSCSAECGTCNGNADCLGILSCVMNCSDQTCAQNCAGQYPNGVSDYNLFMTCIQNCPACLG